MENSLPHEVARLGRGRKWNARLVYHTFTTQPGKGFFNILSTIDSEGEGRVSVARNQSFGTALQQIWRSLGGSQELLYSKTAKDVSASLFLNCCAQIHVQILLLGL